MDPHRNWSSTHASSAANVHNNTPSGTRRLTITRPTHNRRPVNSRDFHDPTEAERFHSIKDITRSCFITLSSCKAGFGVEKLLDGSSSTYWQSDGGQPHTITIEFSKKTDLVSLYMFVDYLQDESYTPSRISLKIGTNHGLLEEVDSVELYEPVGWVYLPLVKLPTASNSLPVSVKVWTVQIAVLANHQNGRDTHVRQIRIHGLAKSVFSDLMSTGFLAHSMLR